MEIEEERLNLTVDDIRECEDFETIRRWHEHFSAKADSVMAQLEGVRLSGTADSRWLA